VAAAPAAAFSDLFALPPEHVVLGSGSYGGVAVITPLPGRGEAHVRAVLARYGDPAAAPGAPLPRLVVKQMRILDSRHNAEQAARERDALAAWRHRGIVRYFGAWTVGENALLVLEAAEGVGDGELYVEAEVRGLIEAAVAPVAEGGGSEDTPGVRVEIKRLLLAQALKPLPGNAPLVAAIQRHGQAVFGEPIPESGTPLYTDVRLYGEHGVPAVIYGAGPRTVLESNAKRADEHLELADLRRATQVVARTLFDLLHG
jgi:hypothetical protein